MFLNIKGLVPLLVDECTPRYASTINACADELAEPCDVEHGLVGAGASEEKE